MNSTFFLKMSLGFALAFGVLFGGSSIASADFTICNKTDKTVQLTYTLWNEGCSGSNKWRDKGWWITSPGQCRLVDTDSMNDKYIYFYAESTDRSYVWTSSTFSWWIPSAAHNTCWNDRLGCIAFDVPPGTPTGCPTGRNLKHREVHSSARNYTLNLN